MSPTSRLYDALSRYLSQCEIQWKDARHLQTLCWMIIGMIQSENVHLNGFGVYVKSRWQVDEIPRDNLGWHFRIRIKRSFQCQHQGQWCKVSSVQLQPGQAYFTNAVSVGKTKPYPNGYLAFAHDQPSGENWTIVSDEPTNLQTFAQYRLRFCVEESFLDLKSNGFSLEASRLRDKFALCQLGGVIALTMLFLVLQGVQVVVSGKRRQGDAHWNRGMSYLKLGWNWIRLAITQQGKIQLYPFLSSLPDPQPAIASKRQLKDAFERESTVLSRFPAS